ncbi:MAG: sterol desaturase family protein [Hyphomonadaceae bacterium]|nr:sterol desaturase family protein [Hyphomonadaceae bacterium]
MPLIDFKLLLLVAIIFIPLERIFALHREQKLFRKNFLNDLIYLVFNSIPIIIIVGLLVQIVISGLGRIIPETIGEAVQSQPIWLQSIEAIIIADIGFYLAHRTFHAVPFLWRFHMIHHSIEEMDWIAAHRVHPVDQGITKATSIIPLFALGFSGEAIAIYAFIYQWQSVFIHSNVRIRFGPLKWILASPQFHHWHHANEEKAFDKNFAGQLPILDVIGGTLFMPKKDMPIKYGTEGAPKNLYHKQLIFPLLPKSSEDQVGAHNGSKNSEVKQ